MSFAAKETANTAYLSLVWAMHLAIFHPYNTQF